MWGNILAVLAGAFQALASYLQYRQQQIGKKEQQLDDAKQSIAIAETAKEATAKNNASTDADLDNKLHG